MPAPSAVYRPRHPQDSDYYRCVEDYFETFLSIYDEYFSRQYGFWRPYVEQVIYRYLNTSKDGATTRNFPALEWLAAMCSHIPNRGEQMVRYYGYYSNVSRGKRQQEGLDDAILSSAAKFRTSFSGVKVGRVHRSFGSTFNSRRDNISSLLFFFFPIVLFISF